MPANNLRYSSNLGVQTFLTPDNTLSNNIKYLKDFETANASYKILTIAYLWSYVPTEQDSLKQAKYLAEVNRVYSYSNVPFTSTNINDFLYPWNVLSGWFVTYKSYMYLDIPLEGYWNVGYLTGMGWNTASRVTLNNIVCAEWYPTPGWTTPNTSKILYLKTGTYLYTYETVTGVGSVPHSSIEPRIEYLNNNLTLNKSYLCKEILSATKPSLLNNLINNRDNSLIKYCVNSKLNDATNVCNTSLTKSSLLSDNVYNYCYPNGGNLKLDSSDNIDPIALALLNKTDLNTDIKARLNNNIKTKYCNVKANDGKYFYEKNPTLCSTYIPELSAGRCLIDGVYQDSDYCNTYSDANITNVSDTNILNINKARVAKMKKDLQDGASVPVNKYLDQKITTVDNSYKFATGKYNDYPKKDIYNDLLTDKLLNYCEIVDPNYVTNKDGQCYGIYNKYNTDAFVKSSKERMRVTLCESQDKIATNVADDGTTNAYLCKDLMFSTKTNDLLQYNDNTYTYCNTGENINSDICKTYYNNIEDVVLKELGITSKSGFANKQENFDNECNEYGNNHTDECNEYNNYINECNENQFNDECDDGLFYILLFIFLLFIIILPLSITFLIKSNNKNIISNIKK